MPHFCHKVIFVKSLYLSQVCPNMWWLPHDNFIFVVDMFDQMDDVSLFAPFNLRLNFSCMHRMLGGRSEDLLGSCLIALSMSTLTAFFVWILLWTREDTASTHSPFSFPLV